MPIEESEPLMDFDQQHFNIIIKCDICDSHIYYNVITGKRLLPESKNSVMVCPSCTKKIAISDLKALAED